LGLLTLIFLSILGLGNPEYTVCTFIFGWGRGAVNLRTPSSDTSEERSASLTPGGRAKRHTKEQVNELFSSVIRSRLPSTTTTLPSTWVVTSSGWYLERSIAHYDRNELDHFLIHLKSIFNAYQITVLVVGHFVDSFS
jgi:hypothetical protein